MMKSLLSAAALAASLAGATVALAQSGAQTGALGSGGSTSNQTGAATATTPNVGPGYSQGTPGTAGMPANPGVATSAQSGNMNSGPIGSNQQLSRNEIHNVQQQLQQQGYYRNAKVDGRWGPHTQQAVQNFQQAKGLPTTGQLDQTTLQALGVNHGG